MAKILIICNYDFTFNKFMIPLANKLMKEGHRVGVICDGNQINYDRITGGEVTFHHIEIPRSVSISGFISAIRAIKKIIKKHQYDIVNSNNRNTSFLARVALITMPFNNVKNVYTARGMYFHDSQRFIPGLLTYWIEIILLFFTDMVMSQSKEDVDRISKNPLVNPKKLNVIHNGIDTQRFSLANVQSPEIKLSGFVVCTIGRIAKEKGLLDLLEAFSIFSSQVPNSTLLIIGGVLHEEKEKVLDDFMDFAEKLNIKDKIYITGLVDNVEDFLSLADVYSHPSYREGVPRSVLEAMSMERIVIATRIRGAKEIIKSGKNGFLYTKGDVKELTKKLIDVYSMSQDNKQIIAREARERVLGQYNQKSYIDKQVRLLSTLHNKING
jgi:glycosyltransferase involved in cell wall biosynthesis